MRTPITFRERSRQVLRQPAQTAALLHTSDVLCAARLAYARSSADWTAVQTAARAIRLRTLDNLAGHLEALEGVIAARGGKVIWARDGHAAAQYIAEIAQARRVTQAVHSQTPLVLEIDLATALRRVNVRLQPTNVGDYLADLAGHRPAHPLASVANRHIDDVVKTVQDQLQVPVPMHAPAIVDVVRTRVRQAVLHSGLSIHGADFAIAETGTLVTLDAQADVRLAMAHVPVQIVLLGIEQVVPTVDDWLTLQRAVLGSAYGQTHLAHVDLLSGSSHPADDTEFHLILLDNGRSTLLASPAREVLTCIRCGACQTACPISRRVGSEPYAWSYPGPVGAVIAAWLLPPAYRDAVAASTLCGACRAVCPVDIDLPTLLAQARQPRVFQGARRPPPGLRQIVSRFHTPAGRASLARWLTAGRLLAGPHAQRPWLAPWLLRWTSSRDLPPLPDTPFHLRWAQRAVRQADD